MGDISKYLSMLEAARELGVSKSRMEQFVEDGRITVEWLGGRRYVLRDAVEVLKNKPRPVGRPKKPKDAEPPKPGKGRGRK